MHLVVSSLVKSLLLGMFVDVHINDLFLNLSVHSKVRWLRLEHATHDLTP